MSPEHEAVVSRAVVHTAAACAAATAKKLLNSLFVPDAEFTAVCDKRTRRHLHAAIALTNSLPPDVVKELTAK